MENKINSYKDFAEIFYNLSNSEVEDFAKERILELETKHPKRIQKFNLSLHYTEEGYMNSESLIKASNYTEFVVDDPALYIDFLKLLKTKKEITEEDQIFDYVFVFLVNKFGYACSEEARQNIYSSYDMEREQDITKDELSIKRFYGNDSAMCIEKSAVANNLLNFIGLKSFLIGGEMIIDGKTEQHSYNISQKSNGDHVLIDFTNPVEYTIENDPQKKAATAFIVLGKQVPDEIEFYYDKSRLPKNATITNQVQRKYIIPVSIKNQESSQRKIIANKL